MVHEHLHVVFALLFNVDHQNLLDIESPLQQVVQLERAIDLPERPAFPDTVQIKPEFRVVHDVLLFVSPATMSTKVSRTMPSDHDAV